MNRSSVHLLGNAGQPETAATTHLPPPADRLAACEAQLAALREEVAAMGVFVRRQRRVQSHLIQYVYTPWPRKWLTWVRGY